MDARIAVVDEQNRFIRWESREVVHRDKLPHRSVHVLVFDPRKRLVVQRRHRNKLTHPGHWDISCAGHVEASDYPGGPDESLDAVYAAVARRELGEELGIDVPVQLLGRFGPVPGVHYEHVHLFLAQSGGPFRMQVEEVEEIRQVEFHELDALVPLTRSLRFFVTWAREHGVW